LGKVYCSSATSGSIHSGEFSSATKCKPLCRENCFGFEYNKQTDTCLLFASEDIQKGGRNGKRRCWTKEFKVKYSIFTGQQTSRLISVSATAAAAAASPLPFTILESNAPRVDSAESVSIGDARAHIQSANRGGGGSKASTLLLAIDPSGTGGGPHRPFIVGIVGGCVVALALVVALVQSRRLSIGAASDIISATDNLEYDETPTGSATFQLQL
jgi:hypothetical protein